MPCACTLRGLIGNFFFRKILGTMENGFFLVCDENTKVIEELANLNNISKEIRDLASQLITVLEPYYQNRLIR